MANHSEQFQDQPIGFTFILYISPESTFAQLGMIYTKSLIQSVTEHPTILNRFLTTTTPTNKEGYWNKPIYTNTSIRRPEYGNNSQKQPCVIFPSASDCQINIPTCTSVSLTSSRQNHRANHFPYSSTTDCTNACFSRGTDIKEAQVPCGWNFLKIPRNTGADLLPHLHYP